MALIHHRHDTDYPIRTIHTSGLPSCRDQTKDLNDDPFNQFIITDQLGLNDNSDPNNDAEYNFIEGYDGAATGPVFELSEMAFKMDLDDDVGGALEPLGSIGTDAEDVLRLWSCYPAVPSLSSSPLPETHLPETSAGSYLPLYSRSDNARGDYHWVTVIVILRDIITASTGITSINTVAIKRSTKKEDYISFNWRIFFVAFLISVEVITSRGWTNKNCSTPEEKIYQKDGIFSKYSHGYFHVRFSVNTDTNITSFTKWISSENPINSGD
ncbi:MAG: hypothetical protein M1816_007406 [Peltula sp. TS41687]|nr:MAG: hypothetical protein M1816_007406 [Peltula sp. TS41687]